MEEINKTSLVSRLVVFILLGILVFMTIFASQKMTLKPVKKIAPQTPVTLTPTPTIESEELLEESTPSASSPENE